MSEVSCAVLGSGVIGLTTAYSLAQMGMRVKVYSGRRTPHTTSNAACALFLPLWVDPEADNIELIGRPLKWSNISWKKFSELMTVASAGVKMITNIEFVKAADESREIRAFFENVSRVHDPKDFGIDEVYQSKTVIFDTMLIETPVYMKYLDRACQNAGVEFTEARFEDLEAIRSLPHDTVFNCLGLGSKDILKDDRLYPVKGQLSLYAHQDVAAPSLSFGDDEICLIPRSDFLILGSLYQKEFSDDGIDHTQHLRLLEGLLSRQNVARPFSEIIDGLKKCDPGAIIVGMRPMRTGGVRLELQKIGTQSIVHNYGHGGSGVTLSWGTVSDAISLAQSAKII